MLKSKQELEKYLENKIYKVAPNKELFNFICDYNKETYNIPKDITSDFISVRTPLEEASEFLLFCLLDAIEVALKKNNSEIPNFFVDKESSTYKKTKFEIDTLRFPIRFKMIEIRDDQWIGKIDFKTLMKFRAAQIIHYNENAQRTMQKIIRGDNEYWQISRNLKAIEDISELYVSEKYIPTPFTLNIPLDTEHNFYYDDEKCELVIRSLEHFDITDGYHRYLSACRVCDNDRRFNYVMELRVTNFDEDKASHFVHQEEQKTHMPKLDSDSMDMYNTANTTVKLINESARCNLQGLISRNKGIINYGELADLIHYFYFKRITNSAKKNSMKVAISKELIDDFNLLTEYDEKYIEKTYTYQKLITVMTCFKYFSDKDKSNMCEVIDEVLSRIKNVTTIKFTARQSKNVMVKEIEKIIMEVV